MSDIKKFLVCGRGMMGSAIAQILAGLDGAKVTVYDVYPVDIEAKVRNNMKLLVEKGIVTEADVDHIVSKISFTQDMHLSLIHILCCRIFFASDVIFQCCGTAGRYIAGGWQARYGLP